MNNKSNDSKRRADESSSSKSDDRLRKNKNVKSVHRAMDDAENEASLQPPCHNNGKGHSSGGQSSNEKIVM